LKLPQVELDPTEPEFTAEEGLTQGFSIRRLVYAMQGGMKRGMLQHYLAFFSETVVSGGMMSHLQDSQPSSMQLPQTTTR